MVGGRKWREREMVREMNIGWWEEMEREMVRGMNIGWWEEMERERDGKRGEYWLVRGEPRRSREKEIGINGAAKRSYKRSGYGEEGA